MAQNVINALIPPHNSYPISTIKKRQMIYKPGFVIDNHSSGSFITKTL